MKHTTLASIGQILWKLFELHGLDAQGLLREQGLRPEDLQDPHARIAAHKWDALVMRAVKLIPDPAFALRAARCWHPSNLGVLGYAWLSSSTLRTGFGRLARYWRLLADRSVATLDDTPDGLRLAIANETEDPLIEAIAADIAMSIILDMCRLNMGASLRPARVELTRSRPDGAASYRAYYGCRVQFGALRNSLTLARGDADRPLPTSNRQLAAALDAMLTDQLAHLDKTDVVARCKASLLDQLSSGELSEEEMAQQLYMSRRTLQRKLADVATTYQKLVDETRRDLALRYLEDARYSITDVTFMLGFSQQSAFTRAFKRWTGMAPSAYRDQRVTAS